MRSFLIACLLGSLACASSGEPSSDAAPPVDQGASLPETTGETESSLAPFPDDDLSCASDADCCVVHGACADTLVLASLRHRDATAAAYQARARAANRPTDGPPSCWPCIPPAVEVRCTSGRCTAERVPPTASAPPDHRLTAPHCGSLLAPADAGVGALRSAQTSGGGAGSSFTCH